MKFRLCDVVPNFRIPSLSEVLWYTLIHIFDNAFRLTFLNIPLTPFFEQ